MSQNKVDYSKGIIYKLCCKDPEITDIYIGSTTNLIKRKNAHKSNCTLVSRKPHYDVYVYQFIRSNGDWNNWDMIEVEMYRATCKRDLEMRERYWVDSLKPTLNKQIPTRTRKEWREDNKEVITKKKAKYYKDNKEVIAKREAEYREANKEVIAQKRAEYREKNKEAIAKKKKEYYEDNKEVILKKRAEYREKNKQTITEYQAEKVMCECGSKVSRNNLTKHKKTDKHIKLLESKK